MNAALAGCDKALQGLLIAFVSLVVCLRLVPNEQVFTVTLAFSAYRICVKESFILPILKRGVYILKKSNLLFSYFYRSPVSSLRLRSWIPEEAAGNEEEEIPSLKQPAST